MRDLADTESPWQCAQCAYVAPTEEDVTKYWIAEHVPRKTHEHRWIVIESRQDLFADLNARDATYIRRRATRIMCDVCLEQREVEYQ